MHPSLLHKKGVHLTKGSFRVKGFSLQVVQSLNSFLKLLKFEKMFNNAKTQTLRALNTSASNVLVFHTELWLTSDLDYEQPARVP